MEEINAMDGVDFVEQQAREKALLTANANQAIEGFEPDACDLELQAQFKAGKATAQDLLEHAKNFAQTISGKTVGSVKAGRAS